MTRRGWSSLLTFTAIGMASHAVLGWSGVSATSGFAWAVALYGVAVVIFPGDGRK